MTPDQALADEREARMSETMDEELQRLVKEYRRSLRRGPEAVADQAWGRLADFTIANYEGICQAIRSTRVPKRTMRPE